MTIATSTNSITYTGDGVSLAFAFPNPFITTADLKVYVAGVLQASGYSVTGTVPAGGSGAYSSGTVTFLVAPAIAAAVLIYCDPDSLQSTSLPANDPFPSKTVEKMIDKLTLLVQRLIAKFLRAIVAPDGETGTTLTLPSASARANQSLTFDSLGNVITTIPTTGTSAALQTNLADTASLGLGDAMLGVKRTATNAIATTEHAWHEAQVIDAVADFQMATGASAATNTTALTRAIAAAGVLGSGRVEINAGSYALTAGTNFAATGIQIVGRGQVVFDFSAGVGAGFVLDAGGVGAKIQRMHIENIWAKGGPSITSAWFQRGIVNSTFTKCRASEATAAAFDLRFSVLNRYDSCVVNDDLGAQTTKPTHYWQIDTDGTVQSQANTFIKCDAGGSGHVSSTSVGWYLNACSTSVWIGGTAESLLTGIFISANSVFNVFQCVDCEDNGTYDLSIQGGVNSFVDCEFTSNFGTANVDIQSCKGNTFIGGYLRWLNQEVSSADTALFNVLLDGQAGRGIFGAGSYRAYNCGVSSVGDYVRSSTLQDVLGPTTTGLAIVPKQGVSPTFTSTVAEVRQSGQMAHLTINVTFTSAGTPASAILVDLPAGITAKASSVGCPVGTFRFSSGNYVGAVILNTATQLALLVNAGTSQLGVNPAVTIANLDVLRLSADYPLA